MKNNIKIYGVKDAYIKYLSQYQEHLFLHEGGSFGRKYIGTVLEINYTSSHFSRNNLTRNNIPRIHSSTHIAIHTPVSPIRGAKKAAVVIRIPHMLTRFITLGTSVSPAPRSAPAVTIEQAKNGSANASIRSTFTPSCRTAVSGVSISNICGANTNIIHAVTDIINAPSKTDSRANPRACFFSLAPILWPTRVVAADATPYPGI